MKGRAIVLGKVRGREVAAHVVDGIVDDLIVDCDPDIPRTGTIYRAVAGRPMKGQGGLFVDLGEGGTGFLRQWRGVAPGQTLLVEVTGYARDGKAIPVTARPSIRGRHILFTPGAPGRNLSKSIPEGAEREALAALVSGLDLPEEIGLIVRSRADTAGLDHVREEALCLAELAQKIWDDRSSNGAEKLLDGPDPEDAAYLSWPDPDAVESGDEALANFGVLDAIDGFLDPDVALPAGGRVRIEPTAALVAVDVDTGPQTSPASALNTNIAAARCLARELRCRGLGGQITVDFAPSPKRDRHRIEQVLQAAFRSERSETVLAGWTPLGLFEMQRKRARLPLAEVFR